MHTSKTSLKNFLTDTSHNVGSVERVASTLAGAALVVYGLRQGGLGGVVMSLLGGGMVFRGTTGHCHVHDAIGVDTRRQLQGSRRSPFSRGSFLTGKVHVTRSLTINKSADELYRFWRNFENLPRFMRHLESVTTDGDKRSHWKAKAPLGQTVEWDAELTSDIENHRIGWKSLEGATIPNSGVIVFRPTADRGTKVIVAMTYEAPAGKLGEWIAWALGEEPSIQIADDLRRFKMLMETGEIITTEGQPSGREPMPRTMTASAF